MLRGLCEFGNWRSFSKGVLSRRGRAERSRAWAQGTSVRGAIPAGRRGSSARPRRASSSTLHQQHVQTRHSPAPAGIPSTRLRGEAQTGDHRHWLGNTQQHPLSPPAERTRPVRGRGGEGMGGGGDKEGRMEGVGGLPSVSPTATYILSDTSKRPSTIISGRKSSLNEEVMLCSGRAAAVRREDAAGLGGSHNCAGRRRGRHRCGGLPAAAASPGSCHISLPPLLVAFFSANPLRNRLLRQPSVERQVLSGEAEPSPRCGSPLTPAPPGRGLEPTPWGRDDTKTHGDAQPGSELSRPRVAPGQTLRPLGWRGDRGGYAEGSFSPAEWTGKQRRKTRGLSSYEHTRGVCAGFATTAVRRRSGQRRTGSTEAGCTLPTSLLLSPRHPFKHPKWCGWLAGDC